MTITISPTHQELLDEIQQFWRPAPDRPEETPLSVLKALWHTATGAPMSADGALDQALPALDEATRARLRALLVRKKEGVPLAYLTERQHFLGIELLAGPDAMIPRKETEILGRAMLAKITALRKERGRLRVMDLCTGSGNLALAYARHESEVWVDGADISAEAIALAKRNAAHTGLHERVSFVQGDLFAPFESGDGGAGRPSKWDAVSCNPPYIPSANVPKMRHDIAAFEPEAAFNGGAYGVSVVSRLISDAARFLKPSSWLGFEVGLGQGNYFVTKLKSNPAFCEIEIHTDETGNIRAILARSRPESDA